MLAAAVVVEDLPMVHLVEQEDLEVILVDQILVI